MGARQLAIVKRLRWRCCHCRGQLPAGRALFCTDVCRDNAVAAERTRALGSQQRAKRYEWADRKWSSPRTRPRAQPRRQREKLVA